MTDWRVRGVDQRALVTAYYGGYARVRDATLKPPTAPFFRLSSPPPDNATSKKKRKRQAQQQRQLEELMASGKFVPLDPDVMKQLHQAHEIALQSDEWNIQIQGDNDDGLVDDDTKKNTDVVVAADAYANATDRVVRIVYHHDACLMPPHSRYVIGDVRGTLRTDLGSFDFILMDPPWENKSVSRKQCYATFHHRELLKLSMQTLASPRGCVLAMWVTNRPTYFTFLLEELLPQWGFTYHAAWYWLKVCTTGQLVSPLASTHRLPMEKLVIATSGTVSSLDLGETPKVVVSVPLRHSWKPPPESFFDADILSKRNLEVFARELRPRFTSVGNEVLKFQTTSHFNIGDVQ